MDLKHMPDIRIIKKHANRRLYDVEARRTVTLNDIRDMITSGENLQVIDGGNNEDITHSVLLQIIVERETAGLPILSEPVLVQMIQFYENPMQDMLKEYLQRSISTFMEQQQQYHAQLQQLLSNLPVDIMHETMVQNMRAWEAASKLYTSSSVGKSTPGQDETNNP